MIRLALSARHFLRLRLHPWGVLSAAGTLAVAATLLSFLAPYSWVCDVFTHFRVQYFLSLALAALLLLIPRHLKTAAVFGLACAVNLAGIAPLYLRPSEHGAVPKIVLRAMVSNIYIGNRTPWCIGQTIQEFNPDLVVLEEVTEGWIERLRPAMAPYPYVEFETRKDCLGLSLYSKLPFRRAEVVRKAPQMLPWVVATLETEAGDFTLIAVRSLPPFNKWFSQIRNSQLKSISGLVQEATSPVLLLGDLNITPWSPHFKRLLRESGLKDSSRGWGIQPTWPAGQPLWMIPIDHCLHSEEVVITGRQVAAPVGSDHCPVIVDFGLTPGS